MHRGHPGQEVVLVFYLRSLDPKHNRRRHYLLGLQRDLWGNLVVVRRWGRIGAPGWQGNRVTAVTGLEEAERIVESTLRRRRQHGYAIVENSDMLMRGG